MKNIKRQFLPCFGWDKEALERYFTEQSSQGWLLKKEGILFNIASFERCNQPYYFQLIPVKKDNGLFVHELEERGYLHLGTIHNFSIFAYTEPFSVEDDLESYKGIKNNALFSVIAQLFTVVLFVLNTSKGALMLPIITLGTPLSVLLLVACSLHLAEEIYKFITYHHLYCHLKKKQNDDYLQNENTKLMQYYHGFYYLLWICIIILGIRFYIHENKQPLTQINDFPFNSLETFVINDMTYESEDSFENYHTYNEYSDLLAPINCRLEDSGYLINAETRGYIVYYMDYHQTIHPFIAGVLARDHFLYEKRGFYNDYEIVSVLPSDYDLDALYIMKSSTSLFVSMSKDCYAISLEVVVLDKEIKNIDEWVENLKLSIER